MRNVTKKSRLVGMTRRPSGGLGNRLFQYQFINALGLATGAQVYRPGDRESAWLRGISGRNQIRAHRSWQTRTVGLKDVEQLTWSGLVDFADGVLDGGHKLKVRPGILGPFFFETLDQYGLQVGLRQPRVTKRRAQPPTIRVGMHFRGTDFHAWDATAILPSAYYLDAMEYVGELFGDAECEFVPVTDDPTLESLIEITKKLDWGVAVPRAMKEDFLILSECDAIICSPSTFCFWAGIQNPDSLLIFPRKWVQAAGVAGSRFWQQLEIRSGEDLSGSQFHLV